MTMVRIYGKLSGLIRMAGLATLHHQTGENELYIDGIAVQPEMRGKGIGTQLFNLLESTALENRIKTISLDVVDTNPKAKSLYERLGFVVIREQEIRPLNLFIRFPFKSVTFMSKTIG